MGSSTDITERKRSENGLKRSRQELIQYNHEMRLINQLNAYLQVCRGLPETYPVIYHYAEQIFPDWLGSLYLFNDKKTLVECIKSWGDRPAIIISVIAPDDCWALRQGKNILTLISSTVCVVIRLMRILIVIPARRFLPRAKCWVYCIWSTQVLIILNLKKNNNATLISVRG